MKKNILLLILLTILISGCVQNALYFWGNYSKSLYDYKKAPSNETLQEHIASIEKIIEKSEYFGKKVPPGIYCEYGYYFFQEGNYVDAKKYFVLEMQIYPESEAFIKQLMQRIPEEKEKG